MQNKEEESSQNTIVIDRIREKLELPKALTKSEEQKDEESVKQEEEKETVKENKEVEENKTETVEEVKKTEKTANNETNTKNSKEEKKNTQESVDISKNRKKKIIIISIIVAIVLLVFSTIFAIINMSSDKIISGISINNIEVSGLTKQEAKGKLENIIAERNKKELSLKYNDISTEITPEMIEAKYDVDSVVEQAYNIGRDSNIFANNYCILFTMLGKKNVDLNVSFNEEVLEKTLKTMGTNLPGALKEASYYIEDDNLTITKGVKGFAINFDEAKTKIIETLSKIESNNNSLIDLTVQEKEPEAINIDNIHKEVYKEAKDAYYTKEPFQIFPEVNGVDFDVEEAKKLLVEDKEEYKIKLTISKPNVTINQIGTEAFPDRLSIFTTRYNAADTDRTENLRIACEKIDGKVLMPGEEFSYNQTLGERTAAAGYKNAKVYENGQVVDGIGGGICQISSTLYNAVLMANLEVTDRTNHQFVTSYLPAGRDATVVYGYTDFKFKNSRKTPIKIKAGISGGIATMEIFGMKDEEDCTITFETTTIATLPVTVKYVEDSSLAPGQEVTKQSGHTGVITETYIIKSKDGKVISKSLLSKDTYNAMQTIINRGVGVAPAKQETPAKTEATTVKEQPAAAKENSAQKEQKQPKEQKEPKEQNTQKAPAEPTPPAKNEMESQPTTETAVEPVG